jgi:hypothetical protein
MSPAIEKELREQLDQLPPAQQHQVLDFARALAATKLQTASGRALRRFAGTIAKQDLAMIAAAIGDGAGIGTRRCRVVAGGYHADGFASASDHRPAPAHHANRRFVLRLAAAVSPVLSSGQPTGLGLRAVNPGGGILTP